MWPGIVFYFAEVLQYGCQLTELPMLVNASAALSTLVSFTDTAKECTRWLQNSTEIPTACNIQRR
jgi:hypothetical protein